MLGSGVGLARALETKKADTNGHKHFLEFDLFFASLRKHIHDTLFTDMNYKRKMEPFWIRSFYQPSQATVPTVHRYE